MAAEPDPGSRRAARLAWLAFAVMLPIVVIFQQMSAHSSTTEPETAAITAPQGDEVEVAARLGARAAFSLGQGGGTFQSSVDESAGGSALQEFRAAISAGELVSHANAARRLGAVIADLENAESTDDTVAADQRAQLLAAARLLEDYYRALDDAPDAAERLGDDALNGLVERHGFFGELVRIAPLPQDHELRTQVLDGALIPLFIMLIVLVVMGLAILAGLGLGITALVMVASGSIRMAMPRPKPGGSVYLESAVLFVACFAFLQIAQHLAALLGEQALAIAGLLSLPAQWLLLLVPLWPLLRGVTWSRLRDDLGLRNPKGVFVEILAGIAGYLALLPLLIAGVALMLVLLFVQQLIFPSDPDAAGPTNPILEMIKGLDPVMLVLLFTLATIWAPLCEELIFRGALFRHMRARLALPLAALLSAMVFGMMHGYAALQLIPVTILGFNFALLRAWRGSLIGPIVAHALNNAVVLTLLFALAFVLYG
ncbi:MAG: lysostaphin resistance A-like protein [Phycisphaerales bacterium]